MLTRRRFRRWFPDDELLVLPVAALPAGPVHSSTQRLLTRTGIPESFLDVIELDTGMTKRMITIAEVYQDQGEEPPAGVAELYFLGFAGQPLLALHPHTGAVFQVHRRFGVRPLSTSLEAFLRVLGFVSGEVRAFQRGRGAGAEDLAERTLRRLRRSDPAALPAAVTAWRELLGDIVATASTDR